MKVVKFSRDDSFSVDIGLNINPLLIDSIELNELNNLIVGKNASGKTTVQNALTTIARIITTGKGFFIGKHEIILKNEIDKVDYKYVYELVKGDNDSLSIQEFLFRGDEIIISRKGTEARILNLKDNRDNPMERVNPPEDVSILQARRDKDAYPYIEDIVNWAERVCSFSFTHIQPRTKLKSDDINIIGKSDGDSKDFNTFLEKLEGEGKSNILSEINSLGYELKSINLSTEGADKILTISQEGLEYTISQRGLSQGLFRSLTTLLYIKYLLDNHKPSLIIIDDLGEGLDFDRATKFGKLLFNKLKFYNVQFLATSNDTYLMNVIDIIDWNVVYRNGNTINSYNYKNSKEKFDRFNNIGLNNSDLLLSDFLK